MSYLDRLISAWQADYDLQENIIQLLEDRVLQQEGRFTVQELNDRTEHQGNFKIALQNEILETANICTYDQLNDGIVNDDEHMREVMIQSLLIRIAIALDNGNPIALQVLEQEVTELLRKDKQDV